ncbi:MAG TPA: hypothetical protein VE890_00890, partial [Thermoguttaceae bacterium]|nr:hypothetical protein [Thermoguttaceae bacterium]
DYNRDGLVNGTDQIIARENQANPLTMLRLITAPAVDLAMKQAALEDSTTSNDAPEAVGWQFEFEAMQSKSSTSKQRSNVEATVDWLLATGAI